MDKDIQRRLDKTAAKRRARNTRAVVRATRNEISGGRTGCPFWPFLVCVGTLIAVLAGCGPNNLNHAPLTPVPPPAVTR